LAEFWGNFLVENDEGQHLDVGIWRLVIKT